MKFCSLIFTCFLYINASSQRISKMDSLADAYILRTIEKNYDNQLVFKKPYNSTQLRRSDSLVKAILKLPKADSILCVNRNFSISRILKGQVVNINFFLVKSINEPSANGGLGIIDGYKAKTFYKWVKFRDFIYLVLFSAAIKEEFEGLIYMPSS